MTELRNKPVHIEARRGIITAGNPRCPWEMGKLGLGKARQINIKKEIKGVEHRLKFEAL